MSPELVEHLLKAPGSQLDASMVKLIKKWSSPPKAIEILEVLDRCIYGALASGFVVTLFQLYYDLACKAEGLTHDDVVKLAYWRYN